MRRRAVLSTLVAFALAGAGATALAAAAARAIEMRSAGAVEAALAAEGIEFAEVDVDGLVLTLTGTAPTEAGRFRALTVAGNEVDPARIHDEMDVEAAEKLPPPRFALEVLSNDGEVTLIGLVPADTDREALAARVGRAAGAEVSDLLQSAAYEAPMGWDEAIDWTVGALEDLPRSQISVSADRIEVTAAAESDGARLSLERKLTRSMPGGTALNLAISAPRPVLTPFALLFRIEDGTARLDACSADTEAAARRILAAASEAGAVEGPGCTLGLGVPSPRWGEAASAAIAALSEIGGGTVTFADEQVTLAAVQGTSQETFDAAVGALQSALPPAFVLDASLPPAAEAAEEGPAEFTATRSPEGLVRLRGQVPDDRTRAAVGSVAAARFGAGKVDLRARTASELPRDWGLQVMTGLDALSRLETGVLRIEPQSVDLRGRTGSADAQAEIAALLTGALGTDLQVALDVTYDAALDPLAALPAPEECIAEVQSAAAEGKITFAPGSTEIEPEGRRTVTRIASILKGCPPMAIDVAAHSDSQGRESMNLELSQSRADAVVAALRGQRVSGQSLIATGYGEARPIADNDTAEGREANRRIEFAIASAETGPEADGGAEDAAGEAGIAEDGE